MLAAIRPDDVNIALFVHVLGAMLLVGTLLTVLLTRLVAQRAEGGAARADRLVLRTVVLGVLPAYIAMRVGAQWTQEQQNLPPAVEDQAWLTIGYITADLGTLLVLVSVGVSAVGLRRLGKGTGDGSRAAATVGIIAVLLLIAYAVAVWAMSAKPA